MHQTFQQILNDDLPPRRGMTPGWGGVVWVPCVRCKETTDMWVEWAKRWPMPFVCRECRIKEHRA